MVESNELEENKEEVKKPKRESKIECVALVTKKIGSEKNRVQLTRGETIKLSKKKADNYKKNKLIYYKK